jgi:L-aspartate oxidase
MRDPDVLVLGSGIAGLMLALKCADRGASVVVMTKRAAADSSTNWAQGGIAAVFDPADSFERHERDTLRCGAGLSDPDVVHQVVAEAPERVRELEELGVQFSRTGEGFALGREGGHSKRRIVHAKDFTGMAIEETLLARARAHPRIRLEEEQLAVDLILESRRRGPRGAKARKQSGERCWGAYVMDCRGEGGAAPGKPTAPRRIRPVTARVTVMATGGCGKVYLYTSNPDVATGDGIAMAYRAGAAVENLEFVQFHPTCLYHREAKSLLLTEALRGEGAVLRTLDGRRFMRRYHRMAELAPRDVVARAIDREMKRRGEAHVYLDITHLSAASVRGRFPSVHAALKRYGFDLARDRIPVVPAAHYMCGGIKATLAGRTSLRGLLALGETASIGLHGANRLASNSLLEALVCAHRGAEAAWRLVSERTRPPRPDPWRSRGTRPPLETVVFDHHWDAVRRLMWDLVGIVRSDQRLLYAARLLALLREEIENDYVRLRLSRDLIELRNIALVGSLIVEGARGRRESRGLHYTLDHPRPKRRYEGRPTVLRRPRGSTARQRLAAPGSLAL